MSRLYIALILLSAAPLDAHPSLAAVVSAAGEVTQVSPGGIATVWGEDFSNESIGAGQLPLPLELDDTRVLINGVQSPLFYVSPSQINVQVPFETPRGMEIVVQVIHEDEPSNELKIVVQPAALSVFTYERVPQSGVYEPLVLHSDGVTLVTPENPAKTNEVIVLYLTGFPQVLNPPLTGMPALAPPNDSLTVEKPNAILNTNAGGSGLSVQYSGLASGYVGLWQLNIQLSSSIPPGEGLGLRLASGDSTLRFSFPIAE